MFPLFGCVFLVVFTGTESLSGKESYQQLLLRELFNNYDHNAKPMSASQTSGVLTVTFGAKLIRVIAVKEKDNTIRTQWWMQQKWSNPDLSWNKSKFGEIDEIHVDPKRVWTPDILLYNRVRFVDSAEEDDRLGGGTEKYKTQITITSDGSHSWLAPAMFKSTCEINTRYFPFDEQNCCLSFGSWAFDNTSLNIVIDYSQTGTTAYKENTQWELHGFKANITLKNYKCCAKPFPRVDLRVYLYRRYYYYVVNLVVPCSLIAVMVLLIFILPPESGERISLGITVLMAMAIFQELTSGKLPIESDHTPLLAQYYSSAIAEIGLALFATSIILNFHYRKNKMPYWLRKIVFNFLGPMARIKYKPESTEKCETLLGGRKNCEANSKESLNLVKGNYELKTFNVLRNEPLVSTKGTSPGECQLCKQLNNIKETEILDGNEDTAQEQYCYRDEENLDNDLERQNIYSKDWQAAARILDRCTLVVAITVSVFTFGSIFLQAPRLQQLFFGSA